MFQTHGERISQVEAVRMLDTMGVNDYTVLSPCSLTARSIGSRSERELDGSQSCYQNVVPSVTGTVRSLTAPYDFGRSSPREAIYAFVIHPGSGTSQVRLRADPENWWQDRLVLCQLAVAVSRIR